MKYDIINLIRNYRWRSFFVRYFILIFIPFLILYITISMVYLNASAARMHEEARKQSKQILAGISYTVEGIFDDIDSYYQNSLGNDDVGYFLAASGKDSLGFAGLCRTLQKYLGTFTNVNDILFTLYVYGRRCDYVLSSSSQIPSAPFGAFSDIKWMPDGEGVTIIHRNLNLHSTVLPLITVVKSYYYSKSTDGYFVANIDCQKLKQAINSNRDVMYDIDLIDNSGQVLLSTREAGSGAIPLPGGFSKNKGTEVTAFAGNHIITAVGLHSVPSLSIVMRYPMNRSSGIKPVYSILLLFVLFIAAVGVSLLLTIKFYNVIFNVLQILQNPGSGRHLPARDDELRFINNGILSMIDRTKLIENELVKKIILLNRAQALSLQSQLNPHFIFNTLHLISTFEMAEHKRETSVTSSMRLLADILRIALDTTEIFVPLDNEIDYSIKYLEIANLRFASKITIDWDIDPKARALYVLKLSLQPILENAVDHGLKPLKSDRRLKIAAKLNNGRLVISIADNGIGMDRESLESVRAAMSNPGLERKTHLGLNNTHQRIMLIFGEQYGLTIFSDNCGTTVNMEIPVIDSFNKSSYLKNV